MKRKDLGQTFSWVELDHPVPIRIVGALGKQFTELSRAISAVWLMSRNRKVRVRWASAFVWMLNTAYRKEPWVGELLEGTVEQCRRAQDCFVDAVKVEVKWDGRGLDRRWLTVAPAHHVLVSDALIAFGKVTAVLANSHFGGQDPCLLDPAERKLVEEQYRSMEERQRDVMRRVRLGANINMVPRFEDPRVSERWLTAAALHRAPEGIRWVVRWGRGSGARWCSLSPLSLLDYIKSPVFAELVAPNKESGGPKTVTLVVPHSEASAFEIYLDARLRRSHKLTLAEARQLASSSRGRKLLASIPLFSEDGREPLKYERVARIVREIALAAGLTYMSFRGVRRTITFHHFRHEYVFLRLESILMEPTHQHDAHRRLLIRYMGWSRKSKMLEWYSHHFDSIFGSIFARKAADKVLAGAQKKMPTTPRGHISPLRAAMGSVL